MILDDPAHWRKAAEEARRIAGGARDPELKEKMLEIARSYDYLAVRAEARIAARSNQDR